MRTGKEKTRMSFESGTLRENRKTQEKTGRDDRGGRLGECARPLELEAAYDEVSYGVGLFYLLEESGA